MQRAISRHLAFSTPARHGAAGFASARPGLRPIVQFAHEIQCEVKGNAYEVSVGYDWLARGWWEVFYQPRLSWLRRLLGQSEEEEMRALTAAIAHAIGTLAGINEVKWYASYTPESSAAFSVTPEY